MLRVVDPDHGTVHGTGHGTVLGRTDGAVPGPPAPTHLTVRPWWDPVLARTGVDPRSAYAERYWLPVVGPSTLFLLRRFARGLSEHPAGFRVPVTDTARALGLGGGTGRNAPLSRTLERACTFGLARRSATGELEVRTHLPRLNQRQLQRLPDVLRRSHADWLVRDRGDEPPTGSPGPRAA